MASLVKGLVDVPVWSPPSGEHLISIRPPKGKVLIKPEPHTPADTFLHIPETAMNRDMPSYGRVFAIGSRRITKKGVIVDYEFKIGDRVWFPRFVGLWVEIRGHKLIQVEAKDIAAIVPE